MGLVPLSAGLNPPYEMVNFIELHLTAQVEIFKSIRVSRNYVDRIYFFRSKR